jgi:hypothetical protein
MQLRIRGDGNVHRPCPTHFSPYDVSCFVLFVELRCELCWASRLDPRVLLTPFLHGWPVGDSHMMTYEFEQPVRALHDGELTILLCHSSDAPFPCAPL